MPLPYLDITYHHSLPHTIHLYPDLLSIPYIITLPQYHIPSLSLPHTIYHYPTSISHTITLSTPYHIPLPYLNTTPYIFTLIYYQYHISLPYFNTIYHHSVSHTIYHYHHSLYPIQYIITLPSISHTITLSITYHYPTSISIYPNHHSPPSYLYSPTNINKYTYPSKPK
ncbi:hypothetical protein SEUBUCD646_0D05050 [Saccharomyces eubayanus]|nr:hypothetical protein SEUBUCD646_0D05050 [Saccharomyces eubayanus]